jgi:hypothetical protein
MSGHELIADGRKPHVTDLRASIDLSKFLEIVKGEDSDFFVSSASSRCYRRVLGVKTDRFDSGIMLIPSSHPIHSFERK